METIEPEEEIVRPPNSVFDSCGGVKWGESEGVRMCSGEDVRGGDVIATLGEEEGGWKW